MHTVNRKKKMDNTVTSVVSYLIYLVMVLIVCSLFYSPGDHFTYAEGIREAMFRDYFSSDSGGGSLIKYSEIASEGDFWNWFEYAFIPKVLDPVDKRLVDSHYLLWGAHLRVIRNPEGKMCAVTKVMTDSKGISQCFYRGQYKSCLLIGEGLHRSQHYHQELSSSSYRGFYRSYGSGGYVQPLEIGGALQQVRRPTNLSATDTFSVCASSTELVNVTTSELLTSYMRPYFLKESTVNEASTARAVFVTFYSYCANLNMFGRVTLILEMTPGGSYEPDIRIHTSKIIRSMDGNDTIAYVLAVVVMILSAVSFLWTCSRFFPKRGACLSLESIDSGRMLWAILYDVSMLIINLSAMALVVTAYNNSDAKDAILNSLSGTVSDYPSEFAEEVVRFYYVSVLLVFSAFLSTVRLIRFASLNDHIGVIFRSLFLAIETAAVLLIIIAVLLVCFGFVLRSLLGRHFRYYVHMGSSVVATLTTYFGTLDMDEYEMHSYTGTMGRLVNILGIVLFRFVLFEMVVAFVVTSWIYECSRKLPAKHASNMLPGLRILRDMSGSGSQLWFSVKTMLTRCCSGRMHEDAILKRMADWKESKIEESKVAETNYINLHTLMEILLHERYAFQASELLILGSEHLLSKEEVERLRVNGDEAADAPARNVSKADIDIGDLKSLVKQCSKVESDQMHGIETLENDIEELLSQQRDLVRILRAHEAALASG